MIVYITTNIINGKKYIGKDVKNNPNYLGSGKAFINALRRYGKEKFMKEVLAYATDKKDLEGLERYYVEYYNAQKSPLFYNIAPGGTGGNVVDQTHKKIPVYQFSDSGVFIKKWASANDAAVALTLSRTKIVRACTKGFTHGGFLWSKIKKTEVSKKEKTYNKKTIKQYDKEGNLLAEFNSVKEACTKVQLNKTTIYSSISGRITNHPYKWVIENFKQAA